MTHGARILTHGSVASRARGGRRRGAGGGALDSPYWSAPRSTTGVMSVLTSGATWTSSRPPSVLTRSVSSAASLPAIVVCAARPVVSTCVARAVDADALGLVAAVER